MRQTIELCRSSRPATYVKVRAVCRVCCAQYAKGYAGFIPGKQYDFYIRPRENDEISIITEEEMARTYKNISNFLREFEQITAVRAYPRLRHRPIT